MKNIYLVAVIVIAVVAVIGGLAIFLNGQFSKTGRDVSPVQEATPEAKGSPQLEILNVIEATPEAIEIVEPTKATDQP